MTYREALEKGVGKWEWIAEYQERDDVPGVYRLIYSQCSLCKYHDNQCLECVLFKKGLCDGGETTPKTAYWVFRLSADDNEKLTAARQIRDALREELRRVTEEEANNAEERQG